MISLIEFFSICGVATLTAAGASQGWNLLRRPRRPFRQSGQRSRGGWIRTTLRRGMARTPLWQAPRVNCRIEYGVGTHGMRAC